MLRLDKSFDETKSFNVIIMMKEFQVEIYSENISEDGGPPLHIFENY